MKKEVVWKKLIKLASLCYGTKSESILNQLCNYQGNSNWRKLNVPSIEYLSPDSTDDIHIYKRLIAAYQKATNIGVDHGNGVWEVFAGHFHTKLAKSLECGDITSVGQILSEMFRDPVTSGLVLGEGAYKSTKENPYLTSLDWHDKAISLGQAVGIVPVQNPEQGVYGSLLQMNSIDVLQKSVELMQLDPLPPQFGAMFGVKYEDGVIPVNHLLHLYTAHRVKMMLPPDKEATCLEIGGGVGLLAYVVASMGYKQYCIVDLPLVNALQGYLLLKSTVAERVRLYGEEVSDSESSIYICPSNHIDEISDKSIDLIVNQDSLPEMNHETMVGYLKFIQRVGRGTFLSINQESQASTGVHSMQGWVNEACRDEPGLRLTHRYPYWLRKGYLEEIYQIVDSNPQTTIVNNP